MSGGFTLPHDPLALKARHDQYEAGLASMAERFGPDSRAWPAYDCARLMAMQRNIDIDLQANWTAIYRETDRLTSAGITFAPPPDPADADDGEAWKRSADDPADD